MTAAAAERLLISGPAGVLEAVVQEAVAEAGRKPVADPGGFADGGAYAVLCHPHPLFGGTMDNKVITTLARAMHDLCIHTIRFNFRGVGGSAGTFDAGVGETMDAEHVAAWGASRWPGRRLVIAGFSFGAYVALRLAQHATAAHLVTIAPPVAMFDFSALKAPPCAWLVVQGETDELVDPQSVIGWIGGLNPPPQLIFMAAGHFFHGRLAELRNAVVGAIRGG